MIILALISIWVLTVIFFILRCQNTQRELSQTKFALKTLQNQTKFSLGSNALMAKQLQHSYKLKLEGLRRHGLLHGDDLLVIQFLVDNVGFVVAQCCEHSATIEEALNQAIEGGSLDLEKLQQFIAKQSSDVRVPWTKNTLEGYLAACNNLLAEQSKNTDTMVGAE